MNCPVCKEALMMTERQGVEIDYCPKCRGVWLDRGELDKIIERSAGGSQYPVKSDHQERDHDSRRHHDTRHHDDHSKDYKYDQSKDYYKKKKKESFLGDLFDF